MRTGNVDLTPEEVEDLKYALATGDMEPDARWLITREVLEDALAQESRTGLNLFHPVRRMKTEDDLIIITRLEAL